MEEGDVFESSGATGRTTAYMHFEEIAEAAASEAIRFSEQRLLLQDLKDYLAREHAKFSAIQPVPDLPDTGRALQCIREGIDELSELVSEAWEYGPGWDQDEWISVLLEARRADDKIGLGSDLLLSATRAQTEAG